MTPKEALRKIKEVLPNINRIVKSAQHSEKVPSVMFIPRDSIIIDWGDTTEYAEPQYRELVLADLEPYRAEIEIKRFEYVDVWVEARLLGVVKYQSGYQWVYQSPWEVEERAPHSQCRIAVK